MNSTAFPEPFVTALTALIDGDESTIRQHASAWPCTDGKQGCLVRFIWMSLAALEQQPAGARKQLRDTYSCHVEGIGEIVWQRWGKRDDPLMLLRLTVDGHGVLFSQRRNGQHMNTCWVAPTAPPLTPAAAVELLGQL